jgi:hypothetical protein
MTFYRVPDGRIVFRPWGSRGACYLLNERQRVQYSRILAAAYGVMFLAILVTTLRFGWKGSSVAALCGMALIYALYWVISRRLPTTKPPPRPSREEVRRALAGQAGAFGRPFLILFALVSAALALLSLGLFLATTEVSLLLGAGFFGLCAGVFVWQLRLAKRR